MWDRIQAWRRRRKDARAESNARQAASDWAMVLLFATGLLTVLESVLVGLVAGTVVLHKWKLDQSTWAGLVAAVALIALLKRRAEKALDRSIGEESDDEKQKRLIREVLAEFDLSRLAGTPNPPAPPD